MEHLQIWRGQQHRYCPWMYMAEHVAADGKTTNITNMLALKSTNLKWVIKQATSAYPGLPIAYLGEGWGEVRG